MDINLEPQTMGKITKVERTGQEMLTDQTAGYKAKAFEPRNLAFFFLIALGLMWIPGVLSIFSGINLSSVTTGTVASIIVITIAGLASISPTLAAFVVTAMTEGKSGVKSLLGRFWNRNLSIKWLLVILLCYDVLRLIANFIARTLDGQAYPILNLPNPPWMVIITFISAFIFNGLFEEFGWRGYALPRLQARWNALISSLILGVIWASWHLPAFFMPGQPLYQRNFWVWAPWIILSSILYTWFFNNTKGSVLAAALFHAMMNCSIVVLPTQSSLWYYYGVLLAAGILIVIIFGAKNLVREQQK